MSDQPQRTGPALTETPSPPAQARTLEARRSPHRTSGARLGNRGHRHSCRADRARRGRITAPDHILVAASDGTQDSALIFAAQRKEVDVDREIADAGLGQPTAVAVCGQQPGVIYCLRSGAGLTVAVAQVGRLTSTTEVAAMVEKAYDAQ